MAACHRTTRWSSRSSGCSTSACWTRSRSCWKATTRWRRCASWSGSGPSGGPRSCGTAMTPPPYARRPGSSRRCIRATGPSTRRWIGGGRRSVRWSLNGSGIRPRSRFPTPPRGPCWALPAKGCTTWFAGADFRAIPMAGCRRRPSGTGFGATHHDHGDAGRDVVINDRLVDAGELPIAVRDFGGDQPPLLLLHGAGGNLATLTTLARALRPRHRVITLDLRGHGRSGDGPWSWDAALGDIAAATVQLELNRPAVVGHSLGGMLAVLWGQRHPETPGVVSLDRSEERRVGKEGRS